MQKWPKTEHVKEIILGTAFVWGLGFGLIHSSLINLSPPTILEFSDKWKFLVPLKRQNLAHPTSCTEVNTPPKQQD